MEFNEDNTKQNLLILLNCTEVGENHGDEVFISTAEIDQWDLPSILTYQTVKVGANRNSLMEHSSYFRGLLSGSFSESCCDTISIYWNVESFLGVVRFILGCSIDITPHNFVLLYEATLFFGVEMLLSKCQLWLTEITSFNEVQPPQLPLDSVIHIWKYGIEHVIEFIPRLCSSYLGRNFMWMISCCSFTNIPYELLDCCVKHPELTVDSEKYLCDAILVWLAANSEILQFQSISTDMLKQIWTSTLPLWFIAGKKRCCLFSEFAEESVHSILNLAREQTIDSLDNFGNGDSNHLKIRLTRYTKKVEIAGCPQIKMLSISPSLSYLEYVLNKGINKSSLSIETLVYKGVEEIDISNCPMLNLEKAVEYFSKSFPCLKLLKAANFVNFRTRKLQKLVQSCPLLIDIDLTVDISPIIKSQVSIISTSPALTPSLRFTDIPKPKVSYIMKLTLEGRTDTTDFDLLIISEMCPLLCYLNIKGCMSLTDDGLSGLIIKCIKLDSLLACYTPFGKISVQSLCSNISANKLQTLHIGGCKGVDEASLCELMSKTDKLKNVCLKETQLVDNALYKFLGSSLEILDVSSTKVSAPALANIVSRNSGLKCLKARDCKYLLQSKDLYSELGESCKLEEVSLGWGFSLHSMEALRPSLGKLRSLIVGLGGSLGEDGLNLLPVVCPLLETLIIYFQEISDSCIRNIVESLRQLRILSLHYCFGEISSLSLKLRMPNLRILKLERVVPWMRNDDLIILSQNCANLVELSLLGCIHLNSEAQNIISSGWPGLVSIHLEVTIDGISSLFDCVALEDLLLRHNGPGIQRNFIKHAASKLPMLRKVSLDMCDASDGEFALPDFGERYFLSIVKISRCKLQRCTLDLQVLEAHKRAVHKDTLVLQWDSTRVTRTIVKERL